MSRAFRDLMLAILDEAAFAFDFLPGLTAVDWTARTPRLDVVYDLHSIKRGHSLLVRVCA